MAEQVSTPVQGARVLLKQLEETFSVIKNGQPLAVGIDKQVIDRLPNINRKELRVALSMHTHSVRYLKAMEKATQRFDLDGNPAGEVPENHRTHASEMLKERFKKAAEKRKEQEQIAREQRRREDKLRQLAEKFSPRH
jgi:ProP effector